MVKVRTAPALTVLMTVYNAEKYLAKAIESILNQTFTEFEFLIINDGSSDKSLSIMQRYAKKDSRIKVISRENKGFITSLREGMDIAQSDLIARMDADDIALPSRLEKQYSYLQSHPECMVVGCQVQVIDEKDDYLHIDPRPTSDTNVRLFLAYGCALSGPTVIFRKSILESIGGFDEKELPAEDYSCWVRLAERYPERTLINLPQVLYLYRETSTGISLSNKREQIQKTIDIGSAYRYSMIQKKWKFLSPDIHKGWFNDLGHITDNEQREQLRRIYYTIQTWFRNDITRKNQLKGLILKQNLIRLTKQYNPENVEYIYNQQSTHSFPERDPINIAFAANDDYVPHMLVAIYSLASNNSDEPINIYILSSDLSVESLARIRNSIKSYGKVKVFHIKPDIRDIASLSLVIDYISIETYYRYLLPQELPDLEKVLYIDGDTLILGSIRDLWETDLGDRYCAGVEDAFIESIGYKKEIDFRKSDTYINAGVILFNLKMMREQGITQKLISNTQAFKNIKYQDQDVINITLKGKITPVDSIYNLTARNAIDEPEKHNKAVIVHFTGPEKPWIGDMDLPFHKMYKEYMDAVQ